MEKIYKLLTSSCNEDADVGIQLLISSEIGDVIAFFKEYGEAKETLWVIEIRGLKLSYENIYITLSGEYTLIYWVGQLRLKDKNSKFNDSYKTITKQQFIDGVY